MNFDRELHPKYRSRGSLGCVIGAAIPAGLYLLAGLFIKPFSLGAFGSLLFYLTLFAILACGLIGLHLGSTVPKQGRRSGEEP